MVKRIQQCNVVDRKSVDLHSCLGGGVLLPNHIIGSRRSGGFAGWVDFVHCWSCIRKGLLSRGIPSLLLCILASIFCWFVSDKPFREIFHCSHLFFYFIILFKCLLFGGNIWGFGYFKINRVAPCNLYPVAK